MMKDARTSLLKRLFALPLALAATMLPAQMHKVAAPEAVTRSVGVYEFVGDVSKPRAARFTPVSLFIGGHFEDAAVYLARPIPFALDTGLRYELQTAGVRQSFLDLVAARNFASSAAAATAPFDDGWVGYGRNVPLPKPKVAKLKPNCNPAQVVQETDNSKPHFGSKPAADAPPPARADRKGAADPCREDPDADRPERISLADDSKKKDDKTPDPERPTLHRSPNATLSKDSPEVKQDKKGPKPPPAIITANGKPADDPDRPTIRHRSSDEDDPNALPPDPVDLASRGVARGGTQKTTAGVLPSAGDANATVTEDATITSGATMTGGPMLRRGKLSAPPADPAPVKAAAAAGGKKPVTTAVVTAPAVAPALDAMVAVSDAKERAPHDFSYHFASPTDRAAVLSTLEEMATAVLANPALATDAKEGAAAPAVASPAAKRAATTRAGVRPRVAAPTNTSTRLADEQMNAYQLYYGAPVTYTFTARTPATATVPERFVTVVAQTDGEGKLQPAMRSTTDASHLDRIPRYRMIDVVDADGSNRASLLMELRAQHTRQFALYRLLGNRPDQIFVSGTTLL